MLDSRRGRLLHETGLLPQLYVPREDLRFDLLEKSGHTTHCPFKGDASYWTLRVGERSAENAVWAYPTPGPEARWLDGFAACYWKPMDAWYDEDEQVHGHLRDPYHRVDVRATSRRVRVLAGADVVAETERTMLLSETGLPNRYYIRREDLGPGAALEPSPKRTVCPYKGEAAYHRLRVAGRRFDDAAFSYDEPLEAVQKAAGHVCFLHKELTVEADGDRT